MELVGEDFLLPTSQVPPWEPCGPETVYVQTGRQALALAADMLAERGHRTLLVPEYLCDSMIEPFAQRDWSLSTYALTSQLEPNSDDLLRLAEAQATPFSVLLAEYFGREPDDQYRRLVLDLRSLGATVIDDETHRVFRPGASGADIAIASLRKLLPLGDGAYVRGTGVQSTALLAPITSAVTRWEAMEAKSLAVAGEQPDVFVAAAFRRANVELESERLPRRMSDRSRSVLGRLNYDRIARTRIRNAGSLERAIAGGGIRVLNSVSSKLVPSHLVVSLNSPRALQSRLAASKFYCPIHWPKSNLLRRSTPWRDSLLSLPVDHRYDDTDMARLAAAVSEGASQT